MQVLRVVQREGAQAARAELPAALQRPAPAPPPASDALGLARHLAIADIQVGRWRQRSSKPHLLLPAPLLQGMILITSSFIDGAVPREKSHLIQMLLAHP